MAEEPQFTEDDLHKYEEELKKEFEELKRKKDLLRKHKEKLQQHQAKTDKPSPTKPSQGGHAVPPPPPPDFYYDVDGEKITNYDQKIEDYVDYATAEFEA